MFLSSLKSHLVSQLNVVICGDSVYEFTYPFTVIAGLCSECYTREPLYCVENGLNRLLSSNMLHCAKGKLANVLKSTK